MKEKILIISDGKRPIWHSIIAAILYGFTLLFFLSFGFKFTVKHFEILNLPWQLKGMLLSIIFPIAVRFSILRNTHIDLKNKRYKKVSFVGPIRVGKWKKLKEIHYVSIFTQFLTSFTSKTEGVEMEYMSYDVNLWFKDKDHITIYRVSDAFFEAAFDIAYHVAKELEVPLFDSTSDIRKEWNWVDTSQDIELLLKQHPENL